jgi:hypothetical protein
VRPFDAAFNWRPYYAAPKREASFRIPKGTYLMSNPDAPFNEALSDLIGRRVRVYSIGGDDNHSDDGVLEIVDYPWLRIRIDDNWVMCFPIHNVRLVKPLEPIKQATRKPHEVLLRPSGPQ